MQPESPASGAQGHWRALEALYASAPVNRLFASQLEIVDEGRSRIAFTVDERHFHAAGAAHGTIYFKMLDDAAFYAANTLISDRFLLTTSFNLHFTRPMKTGRVIAEGRWVSGRRRVLVAEAHLVDEEGEEIGAAPARSCGRTFRCPACPDTESRQWIRVCLPIWK